MPLTPLPEDNTKRYKMLYTVAGQSHNMTARCSSAQTDAQANTYFQDLFDVFESILGDNVTWVGLFVALQSSNVFNDTGTWTPQTGSGSSVSAVDKPRALCFPGRASSGRKVKNFIYGLTSAAATPDTYEEDPLVTSIFQGWQGLLNSQSDFWLAIDGVKPTWYFRVNYKTNDHWVDKARQ
jgi:hypothetical protein